MLTLNMEPTYRLLLRETETCRIILVGLGGTGSHLAWSLARLAVHARDKGIELKITFIDHDHVEHKNVGRQCFYPHQIGQNKAETLAWQLNAAYGLAITAVSHPFTHPNSQKWRLFQSTTNDQTLLIGAVDNHVARQAMADVVAKYPRLWWLDCGNAEFSGQILIGNAAEPIQPPEMGLCHDLPAPHLQAPELLQPDAENNNLSCADLTLREEQSFFVNQMAASIASQTIYQFALQRELTSFATQFNLMPPTMTTQRLTKSNLQPYLTSS